MQEEGNNYFTNNFYEGADYGLSSGKSEYSIEGGPLNSYSAGSFGFTNDPRTTNQLGQTSAKLNTGAKTVEVQGVSAQVLEAIPKQHFKEMDRLRKLTGVDLTFHGPLVEASGFGRGGWSEESRAQAERQMMDALRKARQLNSDEGNNIVVTFHSSEGLPELEERNAIGGEDPTVKEMYIYDKNTGQARPIKIKKDAFTDKESSVREEMDKLSREEWQKKMTNLSFHAHNGERTIAQVIQKTEKLSTLKDEEKPISKEDIIKIYKKSSTPEYQEILDNLDSPARTYVKEMVNDLSYGEAYVKDAYNTLQSEFSQAMESAIKEKRIDDIKRLSSYKSKMAKKINSGVDFEDPKNLVSLAEDVQEGVTILNTIAPPKSFQSLNDFIIDKSAETFSNLALNTYKEFNGKNVPIISIENPPAGQAISTGEDLKKLVGHAREKFTENAQRVLGMSEKQAKEQAEKLIGVTWDVGHINMLRKYGYKDKHLLKETKEVAPFIKHIHLSDNFGYEHTELPMGMGNVPIKEHMEAIEKYGKQVKKMKQIVETGGSWFQHFQVTPFKETLRAMGSPIYSAEMGPYWDRATSASAGYYAGMGATLPEGNFSMYGTGFSNLPTELGGQMSGRSRVSGNPME